MKDRMHANADHAVSDPGDSVDRGLASPAGAEARLEMLVDWLWAGLVQDDQGWRLGAELVKVRAWGQAHCRKPDRETFEKMLSSAVERGRRP